MSRIDELTSKWLDGSLSETEARALALLVEQDPEAKRRHLGLLEVEAALRGRSAPANLAVAVLARLKSETEAALPGRVMDRIKSDLESTLIPFPGAMDPRTAQGTVEVSRRNSVFRFRAYQKLALAAGILLFLGFGAERYFNPTVGNPTLAGSSGPIRLEREGRLVAAAPGMRLLPGDLIVTETNSATVRFGDEQTTVRLNPHSELGFGSAVAGKHFDLRAGRLEAEVARQRPFNPLVLTTPNALVTVVGTQFSLETRPNFTKLTVEEGTVRLQDTTRPALKSVLVRKGYSTIAAPGVELSALPKTGGILRQWWSDLRGKSPLELSSDPRYPDQPDGSAFVPSFELEPLQTNHFGIRFCGYVHPPVNGDYEFWLTGGPNSALYMSPSEDPAEIVPIAQSAEHSRGLDQPRFRGSSSWAPPVPLVAGRRYYLEARVLINEGEGHLSLSWKPPGRSREPLAGEYLSPFKPH